MRLEARVVREPILTAVAATQTGEYNKAGSRKHAENQHLPHQFIIAHGRRVGRASHVYQGGTCRVKPHLANLQAALISSRETRVVVRASD